MHTIIGVMQVRVNDINFNPTCFCHRRPFLRNFFILDSELQFLLHIS